MIKRYIVYRLAAWLCTAFLIAAAGYFGYCKYMMSKIKSPLGSSREVDKKNLALAGTKWLEAYTEQYSKSYLFQYQRLVGYSISNIEVKEAGVLQIDFSIVTKKLDEGTYFKWNGVLEKNSVKCQWALWIKEEAASDGNYIYTAEKLQMPAGYDLEKHQTSRQKERDTGMVRMRNIWRDIYTY